MARGSPVWSNLHRTGAFVMGAATLPTEAPSSEDRLVPPAPLHEEGLEPALARLGFLPTLEDPVLWRGLGKSGYGLFLYLASGLDIGTLGRLADCNDRAGV